MSIGSIVGGSLRALLIAAATGAAAFGLLVVLHPFAPAPASIGAPIDISNTDALRARIDSARSALRETETALDNVKPEALTVTTTSSAAPNTELEAQIAAALERRDLATRHASAIRDGLKSGTVLSSLAEIRDSVVIGQLLAQQTALDATIAEQGARFKANHPTMRALAAQKAALIAQIKAEAANIASALEAEAKLDDAQIGLLRTQLEAAGGGAAAAPAPADATQTLKSQAASQRTELDRLMDAYLGLKPPVATSPLPVSLDSTLDPANLFVVAVAAIAAIVFQIGLALRGRRRRRDADLGRWSKDTDHETPAEPGLATEYDPALRRAS